jgi:hypothetical protein
MSAGWQAYDAILVARFVPVDKHCKGSECSS